MRYHFSGTRVASGIRVDGTVEASSPEKATQRCSEQGVQVETVFCEGNGFASSATASPRSRLFVGIPRLAFALLLFIPCIVGVVWIQLRSGDRESAGDPSRAAATRKAWDALYRTDLAALPKLTSNDIDQQVEGLRLLMAGYRIDHEGVDGDLSSFVDRHVAVAAIVIGANERWNEARARVVRELEKDGDQIDEIVRAIFPEEFARGASSGRRLGAQSDQQELLRRIDTKFEPLYAKAYQQWLDSVKDQGRLSERLTARFGASFPVAVVTK